MDEAHRDTQVDDGEQKTSSEPHGFKSTVPLALESKRIPRRTCKRPLSERACKTLWQHDPRTARAFQDWESGCFVAQCALQFNALDADDALDGNELRSKIVNVGMIVEELANCPDHKEADGQ